MAKFAAMRESRFGSFIPVMIALAAIWIFFGLTEPNFFSARNFHFLFMQRDGEALDSIARLLERGFLTPLVTETIPFDAGSVAEAHRILESGHGRGKIVMEF